MAVAQGFEAGKRESNEWARRCATVNRAGQFSFVGVKCWNVCVCWIAGLSPYRYVDRRALGGWVASAAANLRSVLSPQLSLDLNTE